MQNRRKQTIAHGSSFGDADDNRLSHCNMDYRDNEKDEERHKLLPSSNNDTTLERGATLVSPTTIRPVANDQAQAYNVTTTIDNSSGHPTTNPRLISTHRTSVGDPSWNINVNHYQHQPSVTPFDNIPSTVSIRVRRDLGDHYELKRIGSDANSSRAIIDFSSPRGDQAFSSTHPKRHQQTDFIFYKIQPGDTLQNLSVKYSCPVASIKRLNNLWSDQEFYGLSKIKLPVGKLRLIANVIDDQEDASIGLKSSQESTAQFSDGLTNLSSRANIMSNNNNTPLGYLYRQSIQPHDVCLLDQDRSLLEELNRNVQEELAEKISNDTIFKNLDLNIEKARTAAKSYNDNASAIMQQLAQNGNIVDDETEEELSEACIRARREAEILLNDMSDCGLSYNFLILFIFIVCLVCPLAYVIYLEETHHESNKT